MKCVLLVHKTVILHPQEVQSAHVNQTICDLTLMLLLKTAQVITVKTLIKATLFNDYDPRYRI